MKLQAGSGNDITFVLASGQKLITQDNTETTIHDVDNDTGQQDYKTKEVIGVTPDVNKQTGTTYTIQSSDRGKIVTFNNASDITVTVPDTLTEGFTCMIAQVGAGQVSVTGSGDMNIRNRQTHDALAGQYAVGSLTIVDTDECYLAGDTAASA